MRQLALRKSQAAPHSVAAAASSFRPVGQDVGREKLPSTHGLCLRLDFDITHRPQVCTVAAQLLQSSGLGEQELKCAVHTRRRFRI